ncbi:unnamed protein product [Musa textilis]
MDINMNDIKTLQETFLNEAADEIELEEADDGDEVEEVEEYVTLGLVQKPKNSNFLLRHLFSSKAGDFPAWLDPVDQPSERSRRCGFCKEPLQFLLQINAPISEKKSTFHHMLHVFMCPSISCLLQDQHEQWKHRKDNPRKLHFALGVAHGKGRKFAVGVGGHVSTLRNISLDIETSAIRLLLTQNLLLPVLVHLELGFLLQIKYIMA